jgi:hypothetical protein
VHANNIYHADAVARGRGGWVAFAATGESGVDGRSSLFGVGMAMCPPLGEEVDRARGAQSGLIDSSSTIDTAVQPGIPDRCGYARLARLHTTGRVRIVAADADAHADPDEGSPALDAATREGGRVQAAHENYCGEPEIVFNIYSHNSFYSHNSIYPEDPRFLSGAPEKIFTSSNQHFTVKVQKSKPTIVFIPAIVFIQKTLGFCGAPGS